MYEFMCMLGPGVLTWLLRTEIEDKCAGSEKEEERTDFIAESIFTTVLKIIAYAFINMVVILAVLKPLGRVQLVVLSDGRIDLHYGAAAVFMSVCTAVMIGITSLIKPDNAEEKENRDMYDYIESRDKE